MRGRAVATRAFLFGAAALALAACAEDAPSTLAPAGPGARRIEGLWWLMLWIAVAVFVVVLGLLLVALARAKRNDAHPRVHVTWGEPLVVVGGVILPAVVLSVLFAIGLRDMRALSAPDGRASLTVEVVAHNWWWEVNYPGLGISTAQDIHIPAGEPVMLTLEADDVIHSFWVPRLQAKTDMIPGQTNTMWIEADEVGVYRGQCAEFCGLQHANMAFYVIADDPAAFEEWAARERMSAARPESTSEQRGYDIFMTDTCVGCHTIRGTPATGDVGPDLTHLATRTTLAAGTLRNTRTNLARWITDPQGVKPGADMPPIDLGGADLEALLDYLESLK